MSIKENSSTQLFLQQQMNIQDKAKNSLQSKEHVDHMSSYFGMSNTNTNTKSNSMSIGNNSKLRMGIEHSNVGDDERNKNMEETASMCIQTNENIDVSTQSLDSFYLGRMHLQEMIQTAKSQEIDNIYRYFNNNDKNNIINTNNATTIDTATIHNYKSADMVSMENALKKKNSSYGENNDSYKNTKETEIAAEIAAEIENEVEAETENETENENENENEIEIEIENDTENETYQKEEHPNQQRNDYTNISKNGNHLFHPNSQQNTFESSQQNFSDIYESNMYCNSMKTMPVDTQQSLTNDIIKNNEYKCSDASINMQEETDLETRREDYTSFDRQIEYQNESQRRAYLEKTRNADVDAYNNLYDPVQYHRNEISNIEKDKQKDNCSYEYWGEKLRGSRNMHEMNNTSVKEYDPISKFTDLNIIDMLYQMNNPKYYSSTDEYINESYKTVENFSKSNQNGVVPTMTFDDDASTIIDTKHLITNEEKYKEGEIDKTTDGSTESFDGIRNPTITNTREEIRDYPNHWQQQETINNLSKDKMMNNLSNNTINAMNNINMANPSDLKKTTLMHNVDFYRNAPITTNTSTKQYSGEVNSNMIPMYGTMDMQNYRHEMNNLMTNMRMNNTAPMTRYNKYFEQAQQQKCKSGKEHLDSQTNGLYNLKDIKSFMLEPQLYTKMDLDLPEIVDGITTNHIDGQVTNIKKETVIKYKDTWRLVPGKSFTINQNGNNNPEHEAKLFQEYLDRCNEKTKQMFLNGTFYNLTGKFVMNPSDASINNQESNNPVKVYNYSDPAVAFPNTYVQPVVSTANQNGPTNILDQLAINRMDHTKEYNCVGGTSQFVPANEFNNIHTFNGLTQLNSITGAHVIEAINGIHTTASINDCNFLSIKQKQETLPLKFISSNKEEQKKNQKPILKKKLNLCGQNPLQYNIKTFLTQTVKDYFTGKQSQLN